MNLMRKLSRTVYVAALIFFVNTTFAEKSNPFIDESKSLIPQQEWNREIVTNTGGTIKCKINNSAGGVNVLLVADRAFQAVMNNNPNGLFSEDIIFQKSKSSGNFKGKIKIENPGSYWFILKNKSQKESTMTLQCFEKKT